MEARLDFQQANPDAVRALAGLDVRIARSGLEASLVELVRLRTSQLNGCAYRVDVHAEGARVAGESPRRIAALAVWRDTPFFSDRERAALGWAESVTCVSATHVPDEAWEAVRVHFSSSELVDLTLLVAAMNAWNRFAVAFRKQPVWV